MAKPSVDTKRLQESIHWSRGKLENFRQNRKVAVEQYVGAHYASDPKRLTLSGERTPYNLMELAVTIYTYQLAAKNPHCTVDSPHRVLLPYADNLEIAVNHTIEKMDLALELRKWVKEAMFGIGIMKIGQNHEGMVEIDGQQFPSGQPYAKSIGLDDWVHDMTATNWNDVCYMGDRYRVFMDEIKDSDFYDKKAVEKLKPEINTIHNEHGDERLDALETEYESHPDSYKETVDLWDIYLPREKRLITIQIDQDLVLRDVEWEGPDHGPYRMLWFNEVPGNLMPLPPSALWVDMNELANRLFRKLGQQAERQKTVGLVAVGDAETAETIRDANDGDVVGVHNPAGVNEVSYGGADPTTNAFLIWLKQEFSQLAGNLDMLGGLGPQSDTLGQDMLLSNSASRRMAEMQHRVEDQTANIMRDLAWYLWTDPLIDLPLTKRVPGVKDVFVPVSISPEERSGDFIDYNFSIKPYSMQYKTPGQRMQDILAIVTQLVLPLQGEIQRQGGRVNLDVLLDLAAKYGDIPELSEIVDFGIDTQPIQPQQSSGPAQTTRRYERVNRPGATPQGQNDVMMRAMMGQNSQAAERNAVGRPVG